MRVQELHIGPILGYVDPGGARIFGRSPFDSGDGTPGRRFGVYRVRRTDTDDYGPPIFCRHLPHFDFSGVGIVNGLDADTTYEYQAGWVEADGELPNPAPGVELDWSDVSEFGFRTASDDSDAPRSIVFGSCRYLLRLFGGTFFEGRGDKTFRSISRQRGDGIDTHALLMLGDQIYADDLNILSPDEQVDEFLKRYRDAYGQKHLSRLMSEVPTYMTLDDHEIEDNWPSAASPRDLQVKYPAAIHAYSIYQMSHSPLGELNEDQTQLDSMPNRFWYSFADGCCDFFVLDARTERFEDKEIIGTAQMNALKGWLDDGSGRVKIIGSSVPIFPDFRPPSTDKWSGFLGQRDELLNFIHDRKIRKVVTLSGDVHCSMAVQLKSAADPDFRILSVVSSPFYWPYPHPSPKRFQMDGRLSSQSAYRFTLENAGEIIDTENFTRLTTDGSTMEVQVFGRKGKLKYSSTYEL